MTNEKRERNAAIKAHDIRELRNDTFQRLARRRLNTGEQERPPCRSAVVCHRIKTHNLVLKRDSRQSKFRL